MRGAFLIVTLIAMLIVGLLVVKNMTSEVDDGVQKMDTIQKTKDTAQEAENKVREINDRANQALTDLENAR